MTITISTTEIVMDSHLGKPHAWSLELGLSNKVASIIDTKSGKITVAPNLSIIHNPTINMTIFKMVFPDRSILESVKVFLLFVYKIHGLVQLTNVVIFLFTRLLYQFVKKTVYCN